MADLFVCLTFDHDNTSALISRNMVTPTAISRGDFGIPAVARILNLLNQERIPTTWFIPGHTIDSYPSCVAAVHEAVRAKLPHLVAVGAPPLAGGVVRLVREAYGDAIVAKGPDFLDEAIVELAIPFACEKRFNLLAAVNELGAVPPDAIDGIGEGDAGRIASVPGIFGETRLLRGRFGCEGR